MRGILKYSERDPEFLNSIEGWLIEPIGTKGNYIYLLDDESDYKVKDKFDKGEIQTGDEVEYELITDCYIDNITNIATHATKAKVIFKKEQKQKLFLIDIDGTICDDIPNEEPERMATAALYPDALVTLNKWYDEGHVIFFFTSRTEAHREITEAWLQKHGFKYHGMLMGKPRGGNYHWIDNHLVKATRYRGMFTDLVNKEVTIQVFDDGKHE